ncbi:MAG TPA: Imm42 family immunity protein [Terracidiphilus sp.]|nr:Imm42 family immunity protein [Terracidiphilus sp.]
MMIGNPDAFAIESSIFEAYDSPGQMALGFFVFYVGGRRYGYREPDSTLIGTSFNGVRRRIADRGNHKSPLPSEADAAEIAAAVSHENSLDDMDDMRLYGIPWLQFFSALYSSGCVLAPDNEQGFDDGSYVLQFDEGDTVRLIAFHVTANYQFEAGSLRDVRLPQEDFYGILQEWHTHFEFEWRSLPKVT